jgi:TonB family protein
MKKLIMALALSAFIAASCGTTKQSSVSEKETEEILAQADSLAEIMPKFRQGGVSEFRNWVAAQVRYPQQLLQQYIDGFISEQALQGMALVKFAVERDGTIKHVGILAGSNRDFNRLVMNIIRKSPPWTPGYQEGRAVRIFFVMPVMYKLEPTQLDRLRQQRDETIAGRHNAHSRF